MNKKNVSFYESFDTDRKAKFFRFIRFLKEKGVYSAFRRGVSRNYNQYSHFNSQCGHNIFVFFSTTAPYEWINFSMVWKATKEGHQFWEEINEEWKVRLSKKYK